MQADHYISNSPRSGSAVTTERRSATSRGLLLALALLPSAGAAGLSELWHVSNWSLSPALAARAGYDSNLFARADGEDDAFLEVQPMLRLMSRPSLTALSLEASARFVNFAEWHDQNSIDPALRVKYRYPDVEGELTRAEMDLLLSKASVANSDIGRRVRETLLSWRWEATVAATGKTTLQARLAAWRRSYREPDLNTNDSIAGGFDVAFVSNEKLQLGAGYDLSASRSRPSLAGAMRIRRVENAITVRGRGEFTPYVSGYFYLGLAHARYSEAQDRSENDLIAGARLEWKIRERLRLATKTDRRVYFSPEGDAVLETSAGFELRQEISGGYTARLGADVARLVYRRTSDYRRDTTVPITAALDYMFNRSLSATLESTWSEQRSDWAFRTYQRGTFIGRAEYRF